MKSTSSVQYSIYAKAAYHTEKSYKLETNVFLPWNEINVSQSAGQLFLVFQMSFHSLYNSRGNYFFNHCIVCRYEPTKHVYSVLDWNSLFIVVCKEWLFCTTPRGSGISRFFSFLTQLILAFMNCEYILKHCCSNKCLIFLLHTGWGYSCPVLNYILKIYFATLQKNHF